MASPNIHPEFGYLCTSPRWRRDLRVAGYSILVGTVIGAGAIIALGGGGNRVVDDATDGRAATSTSGGETRPLAQAKATPAATVNDRAPSGTGAPDASEPERAVSSDTASSDAGKNDAAKDAAKNDVTKNDAAKNDVAKTACGNDFWARRDPACLAPKLRRVRVRDATERAALAGVPIGRATPAEVNAPTAAVTNPPDAPQAVPAAASDAAPDNATAAPPAPPVAAPKKSQKTARSQNRRRDEAPEDSLWRDERADGVRGYGDDSPRSRRDVADEDHSRRGDYSAHEERAARRTVRGYGDDDRPRRGFGRDSGLAPRGPLGPGGLFGALFGGGF